MQLAAQGKAKVVVHTLTFLDDNLGNAPSSQLAAEGAAAADAQGKFTEYTKTVFANQPAEGVGYTADTLQTLAQQAGVPDITQWRADLDDHKYAPFVRGVQAQMTAQKVPGTPTVRVTDTAGKVTDIADTDAERQQLLGTDSPAYLQQAVAAATK